MVKRYRQGGDAWSGSPYEWDDGEWVEYADYKTLESKLEALRKETDDELAEAAKEQHATETYARSLQSRLASANEIIETCCMAPMIDGRCSVSKDLQSRLDRARLLAHSWADTPFTTMDVSTMRTLSGEMLRVLSEKWIAESNPGSGVEKPFPIPHPKLYGAKRYVVTETLVQKDGETFEQSWNRWMMTGKIKLGSE